jgi:hypothetical protein
MRNDHGKGARDPAISGRALIEEDDLEYRALARWVDGEFCKHCVAVGLAWPGILSGRIPKRANKLRA